MLLMPSLSWRIFYWWCAGEQESPAETFNRAKSFDDWEATVDTLIRLSCSLKCREGRCCWMLSAADHFVLWCFLGLQRNQCN